MKPTSMNKLIVNSVLSGVLALGIGTTSVFANESQTTPTETRAVTVSPAAPVTATEQDSTLLIMPGDFFYLLKTVVVKIEIAFTDDDIKQAKLLALFTQDRIKKAEDLLAEGKTSVAVVTLQKALADQNRAIAEDNEIDEEQIDVSEKEEITVNLRHNIEALTRAMEKVKNPVAKAALARNIEKSMAKLSQRVGEPKHSEDEDEELDEANVQSKSDVTLEIEVELEKPESKHDDDDDDRESDRDEHHKAVHEQLKKEWKIAHEKAKYERKIAHEKSKHERKAGDEKGKEHHK